MCPQLQARLKGGGKEGGRGAILLVRMGIALVIDVKKAGGEMNRTATWALLAHTTNTLQSINHAQHQCWLDGTQCVTGD